MKILLILVFLPFISFAKKNFTFSISSVNPQSIKPFNKYDATDNGIRRLTVNLKISGKSDSDQYFKIDVEGAKVSSPEIMISEFPITKQDVEMGTMVLEVTIKIKPLECMLTQDTFAIVISSLSHEKVTSPSIIIDSIPVLSKTSVTLVEETFHVSPYFKSDINGDSNRKIVSNLILSGRKVDAPVQQVLKFYTPHYLHSPSGPSLDNNLNYLLLNSSFSDNGCPVKLQIPLNIKLHPIDSFIQEEQIPILVTLDSGHSDRLIISKVAAKPSSENEGKKTDTLSRIKNSFSHGCSNGSNFTVTLNPDTTGGVIIVRNEKSKRTYAYQYENYFHIGDFKNWLSNILMEPKALNYENLRACATDLSDRAFEELSMLRKPPVASIATDSKSSNVNNSTSTKDSILKGSQTKDNTLPANASSIQADTFDYTIAYADTSVYKLSLIKSDKVSALKMCSKDLTKCKEQEVVVIDKATLNKTIPYLILKLSTYGVLDTVKIVPSPDEIYSDYVKDDSKKHPKEKTAGEIEANAFSNEPSNSQLSKIRVGRLHLKDSIVAIHSSSGISKKIKIDSVTFMIEAGKIVRRSLEVVTPSGIFWNRQAPISVRRVNLRASDVLTNMNGDGHLFLTLGDVLQYDDNGSYVADDVDRIVLTPSKRVSELSASNNLNSLINFSVYTDLIGLLGRKPNGLLNTDITGKFITGTRNFWNYDLTPFSFIEANMVFSKFDSKFKSIDSTFISVGKNNEKDTVDRMRLMQNAWLKGSIKFNVFSLRTFSAQYIQLNVGSAINVVDADSLFKKQPYNDILFFEYFIEPVYLVNKVQNFGMELSLKYIFQRIADKEPFANNNWKFVFNPHIAFAYHPGNDPSKEVYVRFNYFAGHAQIDNNFYQLQFGWKTGLQGSNKNKSD